MKKTFLSALLGVGFLLTSCSGDDGGDPVNPSNGCATDVAWLQPGKSVKYRLMQFGFHSGYMTLDFGDCNGSGFVTDRKFLTLDGQVSQASQDLVFRDGDFVMNDTGMNGGYASALYKKNAQLGDVWSRTDDTGRVITHEVVDIDSTITVAAGTFNCKVYKYSTSTSDTESYIFWNDEIGQIKESGFIGLELEEYN